MITAEEMVVEKGGSVFSVNHDTTVFDALTVMCEKKIGAVLIEENGKYIGIWTERDLMRNTILDDFDPKVAKVGDYMVTGLHSAKHTDNVLHLMDKFLGLRIRHLLVEKNGEYIGLISIGDVIKSDLNDKMNELKDLRKIVDWDYYENWRWNAKK